MLRRGTGDPKDLSAGIYRTPQRNGGAKADADAETDTPKPRPLRGLLRLLEGQIPSDTAVSKAAIATRPDRRKKSHEASVSVYRYHGETLRESQKELQKKKRTTRKANSNNNHFVAATDGITLLIPHSKHSKAFDSVVRRHKFVAFFVVQGFRNSSGNSCYSTHTLNLRKILATDYHDVMTTFVLDLGGSDTRNSSMDDEETGGILGTPSDQSSLSSSAFCNGTGFCLFPTSGRVSTKLALLNISKIPAVVVLDSFTGKVVAKDAILSIEHNNSHTVVNRWQAGKSGLSFLQQWGSIATCDCSHGPCCSGSGAGGCCVVQ